MPRVNLSDDVVKLTLGEHKSPGHSAAPCPQAVIDISDIVNFIRQIRRESGCSDVICRVVTAFVFGFIRLTPE